MRAVVQRVRRARVTVGDREVSAIGRGAVVLLGVGTNDTPDDARWLAGKVSRLRIFDDEAGRMNRAAAEARGAFIVVSQFTLYADCRGGNRPAFLSAAPPERAAALYGDFVESLRGAGHEVGTGEFRAEMVVEIENDGPVTIVLDTAELRPARRPGDA